ncbi:MAG: ferrous iron transport protein A [Fimbriimonadales bacterium]|nr:ferrous iron transport protein A [Fimbriimonadales bacterium]
MSSLGAIPLSKLSPGQQGVVQEVMVERERKRRLYDLGLLPGTVVKAVMRSALGDPVAYEFRGATYALRLEDAEKILVKVLEGS